MSTFLTLTNYQGLAAHPLSNIRKSAFLWAYGRQLTFALAVGALSIQNPFWILLLTFHFFTDLGFMKNATRAVSCA
jgi:hypothetical protein